MKGVPALLMVTASCLIASAGCDRPPAANAPARTASPGATKSVQKTAPKASPAAAARGKSVLDELREEDFTLGNQVDQKEFDRMANEVVAVVGGRELRKKNVWEQFNVPRDTNAIPPFNREILDKAIDLELVYREGLRRGLDTTDEFKTRLREDRIRRWKAGVPRLAGLMRETELNRLTRTIPPSTPTAGQVEEIFAQCHTGFPRERYSDDAIRNVIRTLYAHQGPYTAYQARLADLFVRGRVRANGRPVPLDAVGRSLRSFSLADGLRGGKAGQRAAVLFFDAIRGVLPGDTKIEAIALEINDDTVNLGGEPELQTILGRARETHKESLSAPTPAEAKDFSLRLFSVVRNYLLAQQAKREGLTLANEGPLWETPPEKAIINSLLIDPLVAEETPVEPTREEIVAFYRTHPMYQGMNFEAAKKRIYERLGSEKTRQAAFNRLKARFPVTILKTE